MFGLMGKILRVNLSNSTITEEELDENDAKNYLGGSGLATKYLFNEVKKGVDPLGPENKLIFMTGPMTGTPAPSTGRFSVVTKSPLTGFWGSSNSGGKWGRDFKRSGFDGVIFEGISDKPVMLVIDNGKAELKDASHLWGKSTSETTKLIREDLGNDFNVACIGIAGENLVKYACIMNDVDEKYWGRAAGRCGVGTVMGSKRLKAIAARGKLEILVADKEAYKENAKDRYNWVNESLLKMTLEVYGTAAMLDTVAIKGGFPTRNWQTGHWLPNSDKLNGTAIVDNILIDRKACFACPIACGRVSEIKEGPYKSKGEGPEYETLGAYGSMCGVDDLAAVTLAHFLCNEYGIDTISAGSTIAFAIECYQKEILTSGDTQGREFKFGDSDLIIDLTHKIAKREGIGDLLAEGTKVMSEKLGKGSEVFAMHVKGLELPAYDPRAAKICGVGFAVANRGGDHITGYAEGPAFLSMPFLIVDEFDLGDILQEIPETTELVKEMEDALTVFDAVGGCKFMGMVLTAADWAAMLSSLLGWEMTEAEFRKTGERLVNLSRAFNVREGATRADDTLPKRLLEEPMPDGEAKGQVVNLDPLLDAYYKFRGWDANGKPTPEKLKELGLEWLIDKI